MCCYSAGPSKMFHFNPSPTRLVNPCFYIFKNLFHFSFTELQNPPRTLSSSSSSKKKTRLSWHTGGGDRAKLDSITKINIDSTPYFQRFLQAHPHALGHVMSSSISASERLDSSLVPYHRTALLESSGRSRKDPV